MLARFLQKPVRVVAPDPTRRIEINCLICVVTFAALLTELAFLPGLISNLLEWRMSPLPSEWQMIDDIINGAILIAIGSCFLPFVRQRWKELERNRQQTATALLQGLLPVQFPLPTVVGRVPTTVSIHTRRNLHATGFTIVIVVLIWGFWLIQFFYKLQPNLQPFAQQGQIGLMLVKISIHLTLYSIPILFTFLAIILTPRQHIRADQDGLYCYLGPRAAYIPWQEARLFSVIAEEYGILVYELASEISFIRWSYTLMKGGFPYATFGSAPCKIVQADTSEGEYRRRIRILTVLVSERTGLPLVDLRQHANAQGLMDPADFMVS